MTGLRLGSSTFCRLNWTLSSKIGNNTRFRFDLRCALSVPKVTPATVERVSRAVAGEVSRHFLEESERTIFIVELSLISIISLLVVCSAVLLIKKASGSGHLSLLASRLRPIFIAIGAAVTTLAFALPTYAQHEGGEANLELPDLSSVSFFNGISGHNLLMLGIVISVLGLGFGLAIFMNLKNLPVHRSMKEISELIYETCKTYLTTQGKFILILEAFIAVIIVLYFGVLSQMAAGRVIIILAFSLVGIAGSYGVAWFGIRVNTFANSRTAFASLEGKPFPLYAIPLKAGMIKFGRKSCGCNSSDFLPVS